MVFFFLLIMLLLIILLKLSWFLKPSHTKNREKSSPFECGFDTSHKMRNSFSLRFFMITLLFLIFDVEAAVMLPIPLTTSSMKNQFLVNNSIIIFSILSGGLLLEWKQGALEWT